MSDHTGPYDVEIQYGIEWELLVQVDTYLEAKRWQRVSRHWPTSVIEWMTGRVVNEQPARSDPTD